MRPGSLLIVAGVALILAGVTLAWYSATVTYPGEESQNEQCRSNNPPIPCPAPPSPASDQGLYVLGEFLVAVGMILSLLGGVRFAIGRGGSVRGPPPPT
jgi:predicted ribosomally synthesized peptide with SipW-like signal peptide